jgi:hypothetical protein
VGNLGLVFEGLLVHETVANVQEVRDDTGIAHPCVNGGLHKLSLGLGNLTWLVSIIIAILDGGIAHIATLLGIVSSPVAIVVVAVVTVAVAVAVVAVAVVAVAVTVAIVAVAVAVSIVTVTVLWEGDSQSSEKESDGDGGELHFGGLL